MANEDKGELGGYPTLSAVWDETSPTDATLAITIDDEFRALKRDIRERMAAQHWWAENDEETNVARWEGAHRRSMVTVSTSFASRADRDTWTATCFGATSAERKRFGGCFCVVDGETGYNGIYMMKRSTGSWSLVATA